MARCCFDGWLTEHSLVLAVFRRHHDRGFAGQDGFAVYGADGVHFNEPLFGHQFGDGHARRYRVIDADRGFELERLTHIDTARAGELGPDDG